MEREGGRGRGEECGGEGILQGRVFLFLAFGIPFSTGKEKHSVEKFFLFFLGLSIFLFSFLVIEF
jgi:hypothetical protein